MAVESGVQTIADLDQNLPAKGDYISEGDDHLRLIKHTLKQTFPNSDDQLTSPFSELSKTTDYMDFKKSGDGSYNIIEFKDLTQVKNAGDATEDKDLATFGQVKSLIQSLITDKIYPKGSYYISDSPTNPRIALGMTGAVIWTQVTGMLAGIDGTTFVAGGGGNASVRLTSANLPRSAVDMSGISTTSDTHGHTTQLGSFKANGNSSDGELAGVLGHSGNSPDHVYPSNSYTHNHTIQGQAYIGQDNNSPVSIIPPYNGVYIWKRTQ